MFRSGGKVFLHKIQHPVFFNDLPVNLRDGLSRYCQHLHQQSRCINAVLTVDVSPDGHTAGRLAADDRVGLRHFSGYMLESHGDFITFLSKCPGYPVQQMGGGNIADTGACPAPVLQQIVIKNHQQHIGVEVIAVFIHHAQPVCITVGGNAHMASMLCHIDRQQPLGFRTGGRHSAAKEGIVLFPDHIHITAAGQQNGSQGIVADTVHGIDGDPKAAFLDFFRIHQRQDTVDILIKGIPFPEETSLPRFFVGDAFHISRCQFPDFRFNFLRHGLVCIPATGGKNLDAVVNGGIMAGGDGHAVGQVHLLDREHHQRSGDAAVDHKGPEPISRQNLRRPVHGLFGQKTAVIAQTNFLAPMAFLQHQAAEARCQKTNILFGEAIGDDGAPAAGTKSDHLSLPYSIMYQFTVYHMGHFPSNGKWHTKKPRYCGYSNQKPPDCNSQVAFFTGCNRYCFPGGIPFRWKAASRSGFFLPAGTGAP